MDKSLTRFVFTRGAAMREVEGTLRLARVATESLHGFDRVTLEATYQLNERRRFVAIDAHTDAGHTLAIIFLGFCRREFGADAVEVVAARPVAVGASR